MENEKREHARDMRSYAFIAICSITLVALACGHPPPGRGAGETETSQLTQSTFKVETVIPNLEVVWSIVWAPDGRMIFTERPGRVRVYENGKLRPTPLFTVPDVEPGGESGLMSVALHPQFASNFHAGCRLRFGPDGKLYVTTGDATKRELAQKLDSLAGKILRLNDDGTVPPDNPFVGKANARPEIWAYGSRNSQGIDFQPGSNLLFETEHGPSGFDGPGGGDEVNIIERGKNYGWPVIHHRATQAGMESPLLEYTPACAPASGVFYRGSTLPAFKGNFFFGCLRGERIIRVTLDGRRVVSQENLLEGKYGRIRDIDEGPDGLIYFSTSNRDGRGHPASDDDRIMRMAPVSAVK